MKASPVMASKRSWQSTRDKVNTIWVLFVASSDERLLRKIYRRQSVQSNQYRINDIISVAGDKPVELVPGWGLVRIESSTPIQFASEELSSDVPFIIFSGVTQHLHYTSVTQRRELDASSHAEFDPSNETTAVLIPIGKSQDWWQLAQDHRQVHFQTSDQYRGHTAIGLRYVDRVFRKLYHSRYAHPPMPYDFLTYFEFNSSHTADFKTLLHELRDTEHNPEWMHVELEYEIWMTKIG